MKRLTITALGLAIFGLIVALLGANIMRAHAYHPEQKRTETITSKIEMNPLSSSASLPANIGGK